MEIRRSIGTVIELNGSTITVRLLPRDQFSSCKEKGCNLCSAPSKQQELKLPNSSDINLEIGDQVVVSLPVINDGLAAVVAFGLPLLITFIAVLLIHFILNWPIESDRSILTIIITFFVALLSPIIVDRSLKKKHPVTIEKHGVC